MARRRRTQVAGRVLICLSVVALVASAGVGPGKESPIKRGLMLSELTLDRQVGSEGSWVELYNADTKPVSLNAVKIVCNGKAIYSFPEDIDVPSRGIVLICFSSSEGKVKRAAQSFQRTNSLTLHAKPVLKFRKPDPKERQAGCCALLVGGEGKASRMLDFVQWGRATLKGKAGELCQRAAKQRLWGGEGVYIGLKQMTGFLMAVRDEVAVLCRVHFGIRPRGAECWLVLSENSGTPGRGNLIPPPVLHSPWMGAGIATDQDLQISILFRVMGLEHFHRKPDASDKGDKDEKGKRESSKTETLPFRVQIAKDPHFQDIVWDGRFEITGKGSIKQGQLKPGRYYARVRMDIGHTSTNWSDGVFFRYE